MKKVFLFSLLTISLSLATQWQPPESILWTGSSPSFSSDNLKMYTTVTDGSPTSDNIGYNNWNGSAWVWGGDVGGDVNTVQYIEKEAFITYDNQTMYFVRQQIGDTWEQIYKATRQGTSETFTGSTPLGSEINNINGQPFASFPSVTQDQQKLYFTAISGGNWKIYEATWDGSDWNNVTLLPNEINQGAPTAQHRVHVCVTPDGLELYFLVSSIGGLGSGKLAFSRKVGGVWQQWQYCDNNINPSGTAWVVYTSFTYGDYINQQMYFCRYVNLVSQALHAYRSPITVQPTSLGNIKALYGK